MQIRSAFSSAIVCWLTAMTSLLSLKLRNQKGYSSWKLFINCSEDTNQWWAMKSFFGKSLSSHLPVFTSTSLSINDQFLVIWKSHQSIWDILRLDLPLELELNLLPSRFPTQTYLGIEEAVIACLWRRCCWSRDLWEVIYVDAILSVEAMERN